MSSTKTTCCVAGGGPAGIMLGFLLARAGIPVVVLEKHEDFLRDFRGDTVHPSTLELMYELGFLDAFLKIPHSIVRDFSLQVGEDILHLGSYEHLPVQCKYIALMPQWDFLNFMADQGKRYRCFDLRMQTEATDLIVEGDRVAGVRARTPEGEIEVRADLTVACDGRSSVLRDLAGLNVEKLGAPMDVMWFRISRRRDEPGEALAHIESGRMMVILNRDTYWQCAFFILKGTVGDVQRAGLDRFRDNVGEISPLLRDHVHEIDSWDKVKLLTVEVDRLRRWYRSGLLCIGDAAHAMSPVGGVGINLAVQDAVAAANILAEPLQRGRVTIDTLKQVQRRREFPTRITQRMQIAMQNNLIEPALKQKSGRPKAPLVVRLMQWPLMRRIPGRLIGYGVRPEHIHTRAV